MPEEKQLAKVYHFDSYGKRQEKYDKLANTDFDQVSWEELNPTSPYYFFVPKNFEAIKKYDKWFSVSEIFRDFNSWIQTKNDKLSIQFDKNSLEKIINDFKNLEVGELKKIYNLKDTSWWNVLNAKNDLLNNNVIFTHILYRPFDIRYTIFTWKSGWFIWRPRTKESKHMLKDNICLFTTRSIPWNQIFNRAFIWKEISEIHVVSDQTYFFPLYLYNQDNLDQTEEKIANFNMETISKIEEKLGMKDIWIERDSESSPGWQNNSEWQNNLGLENWFTAQDLFDYIYAVLHSKSYRKKFQEFLKIDFPKIPFDVDKKTFFEMVKLWWELRKYHLMEHTDIKPQNYFTWYPIEWDNLVDKIKYEYSETELKWKIFINETQYFENVPKEIWEFYIWGYQPAQKWLKDRKWRTLNSEDIEHYIKIIFVLKKTIDLMDKIENTFSL